MKRILFAALWLVACGFDRADRFIGSASAPLCQVGERRCAGALEECRGGAGGPSWATLDDCRAQGRVCAPTLLTCTPCLPDGARCDGQTVMRCDSAGLLETPGDTCDTSADMACREGGCVHLCSAAAERRSNVGCEYWAVDLDNANVDQTLNAAAQQYAVVISNPQPDLPARVTIEQDDTAPGTAGQPIVVQETTIQPFSLEPFLLGPREVDGSPPGEFDTGTGTALTRAAYRITSSVPVVAYQFNPFQNANVFSNDASLLKPVEALTSSPGSFAPAYTVLGWPQTIADTDNPDTNFRPGDPTQLRAFLTIVGTKPNTRVRVDSTASILGGGPIPATPPQGSVEHVLGPFDVLNLETNDFNADFSGSIVSADQPIVVFSGSEASDAPIFRVLGERRCCADHLEEQLDPIRTAGKRFVASVSPNRTRAVIAAGAEIGGIEQPEFFRVIAATDRGARITTTLSGKDSRIALDRRGAFTTIVSTRNFLVESDEPIMLSSVSPSQAAAGIPRGLPGGDPSFVIVPPIEQFRASYVFLTPDKYSFDFLRIIAPPEATILFDGAPLESLLGCTKLAADGLTEAARGAPAPAYWVHQCQLSFPVIKPGDTLEERLETGLQNDGVHRIESDRNIGLLVSGFDAFVGYGYAGGTQLEQIVVE
jgi:hypothetical protein